MNVSAQPAQVPKFSSREEYRACLAEEDKLKPQLPQLQAKLKKHNQELKRLQDEMNAHVATQPALDTTDQAAVDLFNAKMESLNQRGMALNDQVDGLNKEQLAYNTQAFEANKRCAGMVVTINDRDAVLKERSAQSRK